MIGLFIPVREYTSTSLVTVSRNTQIWMVKKIMDQNSIRHIPVVDAMIPVGIISDRDLRTLAGSSETSADPVGTHMQKNLYIAQESSRLVDIVYELTDRKISSAIIANQKGEITGIFTTTDALIALMDALRGHIFDDPDSLII